MDCRDICEFCHTSSVFIWNDGTIEKGRKVVIRKASRVYVHTSNLTGNVFAGFLLLMQYILRSSFIASSGLPISTRYLGVCGSALAVTRPNTGTIEHISR